MNGHPKAATVTRKSASCYVLHKIKGKCRGKDGTFHISLAEARLKHGSAVLCSRCFPNFSTWRKHIQKAMKSHLRKLKKERKPPLKKPRKPKARPTSGSPKKTSKPVPKVVEKKPKAPKRKKVEKKTEAKPKTRKTSECSICHKSGHNVRTCPKK